MLNMMIYMAQFTSILAVVYYLIPNIVLRRKRNVPNAQGVILTFDDGPDPAATEEVLDILAKNGINACFFVLGHKAKFSKELVTRIVREGHGIGLHGYTHRHPLSLTPARQWQELEEAYNTLSDLGLSPCYYRAPHGFYTLSIWLFCISKGLQIVHWTSLTEDWKDGNTKDLTERLLNLSAPGRVLVLHDGSEGKADPAALYKMPVALNTYLKEWREKGGLISPWSDYESF